MKFFKNPFSHPRRLPQVKEKRGEIKITKRQRFVISVLFLSGALLATEHFFGKSGFYVTLVLSFLTSIFFLLSMWKDLKGNFTWYMLVLPFLYTLSFGLFYFLTPTRILSRIVLTTLFGIGLYSLYLSFNIFTVASMRTIGLLSSARTVSFIITLVSFFFLATTIFTLHSPLYVVAPLIFICTYLLIAQSIWAATLEKSIAQNALWIFLLSLCILELSLLLWFWPATPTLIALFLTGFFYTVVGLSHIWFEKRLFKGVLWEYVWVAVIVLCILLLFTSWRA